MTMELSRALARTIINSLGEKGTPPSTGIEHFTVGLDGYLNAIQDEYLEVLLPEGNSSFKLVVGDFGAGKTHFLFATRNLAWHRNFVVSIVDLNNQSCPFDHLEKVYAAVAANLTPPPIAGEETGIRGIQRLLEDWVDRLTEECSQDTGDEDLQRKAFIARLDGCLGAIEDSPSYRTAVRSFALHRYDGASTRIEPIISWLAGEAVKVADVKSFNVYEAINKSTAFKMIRCLCQLVRAMEYRGLLLAFDEGEKLSSVHSRRQQQEVFENLRQMIDECGNSKIRSTLFLYAVPSSFEEDVSRYQALQQRIRATNPFSLRNPTSVRIDLEQLDLKPREFMTRLGEKVGHVYEVAYGTKLPASYSADLEHLADDVTRQTIDINHRRLFVKALIDHLHAWRSDGVTLTSEAASAAVRGAISQLQQSGAGTDAGDF